MIAVSDKVVCVNKTPYYQVRDSRRLSDLSQLELGQTYVVREVVISIWDTHPVFGSTPCGILLEGIDSYFTFHPARFRRVEEPKKQKLETHHKIGAPKGKLP